jgi:hypothetical protein
MIDRGRAIGNNRSMPAKRFSQQLAALRVGAGYSSARDFYKAAGGRAIIGCTYAQYLNVEAGRSTPSAGLVRAALAFFELKPGDARAKELILAYLKAALKDEAFVTLAQEAFAHAADQDDSPMRRALIRNEESRQVRLTREQAEAVEGDERAYWCFKIFCNDGGEWGTLELGKVLRLDARAVRAGIERLERAGLIVKTKSGRYRCFAPDRILVFPRRELHVPENLARWRKYIERAEGRGGAVEMYQGLTLRASAKRLKQFFPYFSHSVMGADLYATGEGGEDTGLYVVEGVVRRLFDF